MFLMSPTLAGRFFTGEPPGKPKNIGVGSLSFSRDLPVSFESLARAGGFFTTSATWEAFLLIHLCFNSNLITQDEN